MNRARWIATVAGPAIAAAMLSPSPLPASDLSPSAAATWKDVKLCLVCHKSTYGMVWGCFDSVSMKAGVIQLKLEDGPLVARFDPASLKIVGGAFPDNLEKSLRALCAGENVRVEYSDGKDGLWLVTEIAVRPAMQVPQEKRVTAEDVAKLLAGPGRYTLIDARPAANFREGSIATAINVPYPVFRKTQDRLPKDKGEPIVYFCAGAT